MKESMIATCIAVLAIAGMVVAQTEGTERYRVHGNFSITRADVLYNYAIVAIEKHRIGMETLIEYVDESGKNSSRLTALKDQFLSLKEELENAANESDYERAKNTISEMKNIVADFRDEIGSQLGNNTDEAKKRLQNALEENKEYIDSLIRKAREVRRDRNIEVFDFSVSKARDVIERFKERGYDMSEAEQKLNETMGKRSEFISVMNAAIDACTGYDVGECRKDEVQEVETYVTMRDEIIEDFREIRNLVYKAILSRCIHRAEEVLSRAEEVLARAEQKGIDVTTEKTRLDSIKSLFEEAKTQYEQGNYSDCLHTLKSVRDSFRELRNEVRSRRSSR